MDLLGPPAVQSLELTRKNLLVARRRPRSFVLYTLGPALAVLLLYILKVAVAGVVDAPTVDVTLSKCSVFTVYWAEAGDDVACTTLAFAPTSDAAVAAVMEIVADANDLALGTDVVGFETVDEMAYHVTMDPGYTEHAISFLTSPDADHVSYDLWYNASDVYAYNHNQKNDLMSEYGVDGRSLAAQLAVEQALVRYKTGVASARVDVAVQSFPQVYESDLDSPQIPIVLAGGCAIVTVGTTVAALVALLSITDEKRRGLLGALRAVGLSELAYWTSYLGAYACLALVSGALTAAMGAATGIWVFSHCSFMVHTFLTATFQLAMSAWCMCFASVVSSPRAVNTACFLVFAWATIQVGLSSFFGYTWLYKPSTSPIFKFIFFLLPFQHYGAAFTLILDKTSYEGASSDNSGSAGSSASTAGHYYWSDIYDEGPLHKGNFYAPSVATEMWYMVADCFIYVALAWYFGQVAASDHGASKPFYFPLQPSYWGLAGASAEVEDGDTIAAERLKSATDDTVRIHKLSKAYEAHTAVREVSLTLQRGQITALLGQNGAGKSSLIKVLSGLVPPTHGHAFAFGLSVRDDIKQLQPRMGSCPQDDMLWDELSAAEHVFLYSRFKGSSVAEARAEVEERLALVALTADADNLSATFSGGMKRRLSVAMASTGAQTDILFLDEPTTGMDPLSRQRVWAQIQKLKKGRVVLLTTHSMEEADVLGDRIAIMSKGSMRATGTSLFLKNRFGAGYQISLLGAPSDKEHSVGPDPQQTQELQDLIEQLLPGAEVVGSSAGQLTVGLPRRTVKHIPAFFQRIEGDLAHLVKEWGISNSTLEEVFLRLCSEANTVNQVAADFSETLCAICETAPAETVTLFTADGVAVTVAQVVCHACAAGERPAKAADAEGEDGDEAEAMDDWAAAAAPAAQAQAAIAADGADSALLKPSASPASPTSDPGDREPVPVWRQAGAIVMKNVLLEARQRKTNYCRLLFIVVVVLLMVLLGGGSNPKSYQSCGDSLYGYEHVPATNCSDLVPGLACGMDSSIIDGGSSAYCCPYSDPGTSFNNFNYETQTYDYYCCPPGWLWYETSPEPGCSNDSFTYTPTSALQQIFPTTDVVLPDDWYKVSQRQQAWWGSPVYDPYPSPAIWYEDAGGDNSPLVDFNSNVKNLSALEGVTFTPKTGLADLIRDNQEYVKSQWQPLPSKVKECEGYHNWKTSGWVVNGSKVAFDAFNELFPDTGVRLREASADDRVMDYKIYVYPSQTNWENSWVYTGIYAEEQSDPGYTGDSCVTYYVGGLNWDLASDVTSTCSSNGQNNEESMQLPTLVSAMNMLLLDEGQSFSVAYQRMPIECYTPAVSSGAISLQLILFPLISSFLLPVFVGVVTTEKADRLYALMTIEGLHAASYWAGMYAFGFIIFTAASFFYMAVGYAGGVGTFTNASAGVYAALLLTWSHAQCGLAALIAALIPSPRFAQIFAYALIVINAVLGMTLNDATSGLNPYPFALLFVPPLAYARAMSLVLQFGGSTIPPSSDLGVALLMLLLMGTVCLALGVYLHAVVPVAGYVPKHPLFCLLDARRAVRERRGQRSASAEELPLMEGSFASKEDGGGEGEDDDVRRERERVCSGAASDAAIRLVNLVKVFPGGKRAVNDVCLGIEKGECFGLLGPNGAGKTTIINILSGSLRKTAGTAYVGGCDTATHMDRIHTFLGVCPQFDTVWPDLTTSEHLLFYARLKGTSRHRERAVVQRAAELVELDGDAFNMTASELSGGMRRRLSLGIALIGEPDVVFLDEPTTGLDPDSRRGIWQAIQRARQRHPEVAFVLTTHSMEEADILSSRIGIMSQGSLRCLGSPQHLKAKYGEGFKLALVVAEEKLDAVHAVLQAEVCPDATLKHQFGKAVTYALPRAGVSVATVFNVLERLKRAGEIDEWGLAQSSLEEVFVRIALAAEEGV